MSNLALIGPIGPLEIGIVLLIVLIIFGPKRLPELGKSLGSGMRGFKDSVTGKDTDDEQEQLDRPSKADATATDEGRETERATAGPAGSSGDTRS
jgi:sec-independent protein translocase protein TatA